MKDYRTTEQYQRTNRDMLGPIHLGFGALFLGMYTLSSCTERGPKESIPDTVEVKSQDLTYRVDFTCTREHLYDGSCIQPGNIESIFVNRTDFWSITYSKNALSPKDELTPQIQESAWNMVRGEEYMRTIAEKREKEGL